MFGEIGWDRNRRRWVGRRDVYENAGSHHRTKAGGAKLSIFLETRRGYEYESRCDVAKGAWCG